MTDEEELAVLNAGLRGDDADQKELAALNARLTQTPQSDEDELAALNAGLRGTNDASKGEKKELRTGSPTWAGIKGFFSGLAEGAWAGGNAAANKIVKAIPEVGIGLESAAGHGVRFVGKGLRAIGAEGIGKAVESAGEGIVGSAAGTKAWLDEKLPSNAKDWLGYEDWSTKASDWVGNAASMAVKFAPGSAAVGGKAFMEAIFESDGVNAFAQVHDTAKANGASEAEAMALGGEAALINYFGGKALMRAGGWADGVKSAGGKFLASGAASSATMAAQGAGNRMVENMAERKPLMEGVAAEAGKGLVEGAMFHVYNAIPGYARGVVANRAERRKHEEYIRDLVLEHAKTEEGAAQLAVYLDSPALDAAIQARKAGREITGKMASEIGLPDVMTTAEVEGVIDAVSGQRRARAERVRLGMDEVQAQALAETVGSYVGEDAKLFEAVWLKAAENISDARELDDPARREEIVQKAAEEIGGETAEADRIVLDYDRATGGSNVINGDTIRSQMKGFVASDPETHKKLQPRSNEIRERIFAAKLAARKGKGGEAPGHVLFTMGGPGSGKSSTTEAMSKTVDFTYDSTGANYKDLSDKVRRVIANGQTPVVEFVYCDPATAWERAKGRVEDGGHAASAGEFADMHIDARNNLERLISEFGNGIIVRIYDNTGKSPVEISLEELYGRPRYDKAAIAEITGRLDNAAREAGSGSRGGARGGEGPQVASSKPLELFRQLDEGKLPVEEVAIGDVEAIAPTENGNFIEEYDAAKAKPIVVWEDLEGNRHAVTGGKRLLSADASGAETIKAVVVREADGWSEADARGLGATENLREGRGTIKNVVDAVGTLGADRVAELAGWHQANGSRDFASTLRKGLAVAQKGAPELKAALAEGRIGEDFAYNAAQVLSMERVGEGWETAQRELAELIGKVGPEELEAVLWGLKGQLSAKADRSDIDWGAAIAEERAKYNAKKGGADGKLDSDAVLMETEDGELKTLGEVEAENGEKGRSEKEEGRSGDENPGIGNEKPKTVSIAKEGIEYREAKVRLDEQKGKDFSNSRTGISARLSSTGARKLISDAAVAKSVANGFTRRQHNEIAANVGALFEDASLVESRPDKAGDINVKSIKRFITPIEVDGKEAVAWITVKESTEHGHRIYSVEGIKIAALSPSMRRALADRNSADNAASVEESQSVLDGLNPRKYTATLPTAGSIPNNTLRVNEGEAPNFAAAQGAAENKAVELRPAGDKPGVFTTLSHPEARFTVDGETRTVAIDGLTEADFEPGRIGQTAALVAKVEAYAANHLMKIGFRDDGVQRLWETVRENIKAEGKEAYSAAQVEAKRKVVLEQLKKSGLAEEVVESAEEFNRLFEELSGEALRAGEEVYGFCDPKTKKIYLNPEFFATQQGLEVPIHEFGHLGVIACEKVNKAVYDQGMKLAKELLEGRGLRGAEPANQDREPANQDRGLQGLVDFILNDRVYSKQSREEQAQELLAQLIGKRGEEALRAESNKSVVAKVKAWLVEFWNTFGKAMGLKDITPEEAAKMTVEDVADAIRAEMLSGRKYGEGFAGVEFSEGGAKVKTKPTRIRRKLTGRRKAVNDFVAKMGGGEDPANTETDLLALWVDNGGQLFDKIPYEVETGYSKGKSGMKLRKSSVADEFAESTAFYKGLTPAQRKVYFGTGKLEHGSIGGTLAEKLADAGITRFTNEDGTVDYEAVIGEFERQWTNYERGEQYLKERGEREEEHDRAIVEEMERAEQAEYEAVFGKDAPDALTPEEAAAQDAQIAADMEAGLFSRKGGPLFSRAVKPSALGDGKQRYYEVPFEDAVDKIVANRRKNGKKATAISGDYVFVGETPSALEDIGFFKLPIMMTQHHIETCFFNETRGKQWGIAGHMHGLGSTLKRVPAALKEPVMVIASKSPTGKDTSVVAITSVPTADGDMILPIVINGEPNIDGSRITAHVLTSAHGRKNTWKGLVSEAIETEENGGVGIFYIDKAKASKVFTKLAQANPKLASAGLKYAKKPQSNGTLHSIADADSPVKGQAGIVKSQTATRQFKNWFGGSKVVDANGEPLVVYHGTQEQFNAFDGGAFFTDDYYNADGYANGERVMECYLSIKDPLVIDCKGRKWDELDTPYGTTTRDVVASEEARKHDGVIFKNIKDNWIDDADAQDPGTVYYVHNSNQVKSATENIGTFDPGNNDIRFSRGGKPPEAEHVKLTRVADDAGQGEQTPGAMAASRELSRQGAVPINTKGTRYVSLPMSEMNALARYLTGHALPAEMESGRKLGTAGKASLKHRKLTIAADVLGVVDKTDMAAEKAMLKQHGFFAHEDSNWCATHSPAEVRKERERSEEALSSRLEKIADKRIAGREPGGMAAGRKVFADQLAQVVMTMPHGQPGALGAMQTVAGALEKRVRGSETEAETFLDWMSGQAQTSGQAPRSAQERKAGMFAAFLIMPKEMEARAKGWYDAIRSTIAGDQKLADAFRKMTARMMSEQGHAHLEAEILRAQDAQTEAAIKKLQAEANEPIKAGGKLDQAKETVVLSCDDRMGAAVVRVDAAAKVYLAAQKLLMKQAKTPAEKAQIKQQTDLFMGQLAQAKNQAELSRTAWERGRNNADARYLWRMVDLLNEATVRDGLRVRDLSLYLDQMRVIETRGLSGSRGESARQAQLIIDAMRKRLGADFAKVESFARRFHAIHEQELLNNPLLEKILGKGTADYWRSQTSYVTTKRTFSPEELAEIEAARRVLAASGAAGGDTVVGQMFKYCGRPEATAKLKGSFADKQEVMSATFEKVAEVQRFLRRSEYVIRLRDMLKLANVEGVHDMPAGKNEFKSNKRYGAISYMENGQKRTLVVPREIADGFERQSMYNSRALKICASVNNIARQLWIDWNPVYWHRNLSRNAGSIEMNMPGMRESIIKRGARFVFPGLAPVTEMAMTHLVRHMPERMSLGLRKIWGEHTALYYAPKAKRMAMWLTDHSEMQRRLWDAEKRGDLGAVQEMEEDRRDMLAALKANMLVGISAGKASGTAGFLDDSVKTVGKTMQREMQDWKAKSKFRKVLDTVNIFSKNAEQQVFEDIMAKFSAYLHDRAQFGTGNNRTAEESGLLVKKNVSIGEGERKGETAGITQAIFQPFWNMVEKGVVRNVKAYKERPAETFGKAAWRIAPMLLQGLIGSGAVAAWILKSNDGDEEKAKNGPMGDVYRYLRDAQRAYQNCSNYVRNNYHVTPLWTDGYTSIVIGMPLTDEERLLKPIARFVADAASVASGTKESLDVAGFLSDATGVIAPDFKIAGALPTLLDDTVHAFWENPEDYYTGGQKYDNDTWALRNESWEMRGKFTAAMAKRLWNDFGGRNVLPVDRAGVDNGLGRAPGWVAKMVNDIPVVSPILRSFVKVQVGSPKRDAAEITEAEARRRAVCRVCAKELFETAHKAKGDISIDQEQYNGRLAKWKERYNLADDELADIEGRYLNAWRSYEGAQYRADGEREKYRVKAERLGMDAANIWLDFD
ncbi:MAG: zeta toxin family protein [Kiritimatiellae bacterium]|nr:zeta toxin family protein [Kiritimatiellia bacterium]